MVKPDPKIFEDLTRVAGGAMNLFSGIREQILNDAKARFEEMASRMDLVPREDFDRLELQVRDLQKRLDAVQGKAPAKKPASKPAAAKAKTTKKPKKKS
jgi:BMFP domain-containing protein YqiC